MITDEEEIERDMSRGRGRAVERGRGRRSSSRRINDGARTRQRVRTLADKEEIESNSEQGDMSRGRGRAVRRGRGRCSSPRRPLGRKNEEPRTKRRERTQRVGKNIIFFN